jgi:hypothetical protein
VKRVSDECAAPRACAQRAHPHPAAQSPVCASLLRRTRPLEPRNHFTDCSTSPRLPESVPCTHIALKSGRFVVQGFCKALYSPTDLSNLHPRCAAPRTLTPARTVQPLLPPDMHGPSRSRIGPVPCCHQICTDRRGPASVQCGAGRTDAPLTPARRAPSGRRRPSWSTPHSRPARDSPGRAVGRRFMTRIRNPCREQDSFYDDGLLSCDGCH